MRIVVLILLALSTVLATAANAEEEVGVSQPEDNADPTFSVEDVRAMATNGEPTSSGGTVVCEYREYLGPERYLWTRAAEVDQFEEGDQYIARCTGDGIDVADYTIFEYTPAEPAISAEDLARRAEETLVVAYPIPHTNPDDRQLVGVPTWLWVESASWDTATATASIPSLTVSATARPTAIEWDLGDGSEPVVCDGPGTPYDTERPPEAQDTDCSHLYQDAGTYDASVTVTWGIEWSATNGDGGVLDPVERTTTFTVDVGEVQAVIVD